MLISEFQERFYSTLKGIYDRDEIKSLYFLIMENVLGYSKSKVIVDSDIEVNRENEERLLNVLNRLQNHEPVQYIVGLVEFYGLKINVLPEVLIPRPETEELVNLIVKENKSRQNLRIADIGTGTGCIPIALGKNLDLSELYAIDISKACINLAKSNATMHNQNIDIIYANILDEETNNLLSNLDIVVSNPPYVRQKEKEFMKPNVLNFEPHLALFVDDSDPLKFYKAIALRSCFWLKSGGILYLEINEYLGDQTAKLLVNSGYINIHIINDMFGKNRFIKAEKE